MHFFRLSALQNREFQGCFPKTEVLGKPLGIQIIHRQHHLFPLRILSGQDGFYFPRPILPGPPGQAHCLTGFAKVLEKQNSCI
jgi:hypothetical protein